MLFRCYYNLDFHVKASNQLVTYVTFFPKLDNWLINCALENPIWLAAAGYSKIYSIQGQIFSPGITPEYCTQLVMDILQKRSEVHVSSSDLHMHIILFKQLIFSCRLIANQKSMNKKVITFKIFPIELSRTNTTGTRVLSRFLRNLKSIEVKYYTF